MKNKPFYHIFGYVFLLLSLWGCIPSQYATRNENKSVPENYNSLSQDTLNVANQNWREYFADNSLAALIDTALKNNQELNVILQEIEVSNNETLARKGAYLPFLNVGLGAGVDKTAQYTRLGAVEEQLSVAPGTAFPKPLQDYTVGASVSWEIDVWGKLHNAEKSAVSRYLASIEGKNFMVTHLISEISEAYYELMALDNLLDIIEKNIDIQSKAFNVIKQQKEFAKVTQLAVNRFEAQLLNTQNRRFAIKQKIVETENRINFLTARFPKPIARNSGKFLEVKLDSLHAGIPAQLLVNRPDVRQAEFALAAAKLDVEVAKANFYPTVGIRAGIGFQAFNPAFLINPESLLFNLVGDLVAPLINRNALEAAYNTATVQQIQAVYRYEQSILNAYVDILNQLSKLDNFTKSYETKSKEVEILVESVTIANNLFNSAKADYAEVLFTQKEALEAKTDAVEIKLKQLQAKVNIYRALGGGWK
jgi:NodT family efflux transporter outer membrane factor (OMF) lipoprotein